MVIAIFVFAFVGRPEWYWLILSRIALLPLIAGLAYEVIRFAGKHSDNRLLMTMLAPGMWLQRLTTRQPADDQVEVSIRALQRVLEREAAETPEEQKADANVEVDGVVPRIVREADVTWEGTVSRGSGVVSASSSGAFELPVTIASRVGDPEGKTSPEELLAAAHASCFVTSLGGELARAETPPERLTSAARSRWIRSRAATIASSPRILRRR